MTVVIMTIDVIITISHVRCNSTYEQDSHRFNNKSAHRHRAPSWKSRESLPLVLRPERDQGVIFTGLVVITLLSYGFVGKA